MQKSSLFIISFFLAFSVSSQTSTISIPKEINIEILNKERGQINYDFNELIVILEDTGRQFVKKEILDKANEFEKVLFSTKNKLLDENLPKKINLLQYLLEFNFYRTAEEKQLINFYMANCFGRINSPRMAINFLNDSIFITLEKIERKDIRYNLYNEFANQLNRIGSYQKSLKAFGKQMEIAFQENDSFKISRSRNNYGYMHQQLINYDSAAYYYRLNQNIRFKKFEPIFYAFSFGNYGVLKMHQNHYDSAIYYLKKEARLIKEIPSNVGLENTYFSIGNSYKLKNQLDSAEKYINLCVYYCNLNNNKADILKSYQLLLKILALKLGDEAFEKNLIAYFKLNSEHKKSIIDKSINEELKISKQLKKFNNISSTKLFLDKLKSNNLQLLLTTIMLVFILILIAFYFVARNKNRKKLAKASNELNENNKRLKNLYLKESDTSKRNEILLMELHHRVKNNLQMISSLFNLQLNAYGLENSTSNFLRKAQNRVQSISLVHKKMYQSSQIDELDFSDYLNSFTKEIIKNEPISTDITIDVEPINLSINFAVPLGLIFNELLTNSLKYANSEENTQIRIKQLKKENKFVFVYTDNGKGIRLDQIQKEDNESIGLSLISLLSEQINATIEYKEADPGNYGFWFSIEVPLTED